jgi:KDO2-lipid IV(A) lauroyltransferase
MAMEHSVPMIVACTMREGRKYRVHLGQIIDPLSYDRSMDAITAITQQFTTELECQVRRAPEQYLWLHRRWKHQPVAKVKKKVA